MITSTAPHCLWSFTSDAHPSYKYRPFPPFLFRHFSGPAHLFRIPPPNKPPNQWLIILFSITAVGQAAHPSFILFQWKDTPSIPPPESLSGEGLQIPNSPGSLSFPFPCEDSSRFHFLLRDVPYISLFNLFVFTDLWWWLPPDAQCWRDRTVPEFPPRWGRSASVSPSSPSEGSLWPRAARVCWAASGSRGTPRRSLLRDTSEHSMSQNNSAKGCWTLTNLTSFTVQYTEFTGEKMG